MHIDVGCPGMTCLATEMERHFPMARVDASSLSRHQASTRLREAPNQNMSLQGQAVWGFSCCFPLNPLKPTNNRYQLQIKTSHPHRPHFVISFSFNLGLSGPLFGWERETKRKTVAPGSKSFKITRHPQLDQLISWTVCEGTPSGGRVGLTTPMKPKRRTFHEKVQQIYIYIYTHN